MNKELKVYKQGLGTFRLTSCIRESDEYLRLVLDGDEELRVDDALISVLDLAKGNFGQMIIIQEIIDNEVTVRLGSFDPIELFDNNETFTIISTWRNESN